MRQTVNLFSSEFVRFESHTFHTFLRLQDGATRLKSRVLRNGKAATLKQYIAGREATDEGPTLKQTENVIRPGGRESIVRCRAR